VIIEAIVPSEENLKIKIKEIGFIELMMRYAAEEPPFQPGSRLEDVKNLQGRQMLADYRKKSRGVRLQQRALILPSSLFEHSSGRD
jgi:hypothetical protein